MSHENLPVFARWSKFLGWLLNTTEKFPKKIRFTISSRIDNMALDVLENIIEAAYSKNRLPMLKKANLNIEKLRVFMRLCHEQKYLGGRAYEHAVKELYESGKMIGGWIRSQQRQ